MHNHGNNPAGIGGSGGGGAWVSELNAPRLNLTDLFKNLNGLLLEYRGFVNFRTPTYTSATPTFENPGSVPAMGGERILGLFSVH